MVAVHAVCGICCFFLACRGEDFLDGDDYDYKARVFHPACGEFAPDEAVAIEEETA